MILGTILKWLCKSINLITLQVGAGKGMVLLVNRPKGEKNSQEPNCKNTSRERAIMTSYLTCASSSWLLGRLRKQAGHCEGLLAARKSFRWDDMCGSKAGSFNGYFSSQI